MTGTNYLAEEMAELWRPILGDETADFFKIHGYYSKLIKELNLRIIVLNTQVCDIYNFYVLSAINDPGKQLEWMRKTLYEAEKYSEKVMILGHIPPGDVTCHSEFGNRYSVLVDRFENIIRGQFFGHTHVSQFQIVRSLHTQNPVSIA